MLGSTDNFILCISLSNLAKLFLTSPVQPFAEAILLCFEVPAFSREISHIERTTNFFVGVAALKEMYSVRGAKHVVLQRKKGGLGFSVKGGKEHGIPIVVSFIQTDCVPGCVLLQHRPGVIPSFLLPANELRLGDEILAVNGESVQGATHSEAVQKLKRAGQAVTLLIRSNQTLEGT